MQRDTKNVMRILNTFVILLILQGTQLYAQPSEDRPIRPRFVPIEVNDLDTLIFIAIKYKGLDSAFNASLAALEALQASNSHKDGIIHLQGDQLTAYANLTENLKAQNLTQNELFFIDKARLKTTIRKQRKIIVGEGLGILLLLALILL